MSELEQLVAERGVIINPTVSASWQRCLDVHRLSPYADIGDSIIRREQARESIEEMGSLFLTCCSQVRDIFKSINSSGHSVVLTDRHGVIIDYAIDNSCEEAFVKRGLVRGADWSEASEGSNAVGVAIYEKRSQTFIRSEHFRIINEGLTCTAAPIFDELGEVLAVLDVSSVGRCDDPEIIAHTRALLEMSARLLSRRHFQEKFSDQWIIRFHHNPERIGLLEEGLLAVDESGEILAADNQAVSLLRATTGDSIVHHKLNELFGQNFSGLIDQQSDHPLITPARSQDNNQPLYAKLVQPVARPVSRANRKASRIGKKRELSYSFKSLAGSDAHMQNLISKTKRLLNHDLPFLIEGETGVGKEVFAKAIHSESNRADKPFIAVNCAAMPASLIEGELFGYRPGAFTGAHPTGFKGRFVQANGGTIFLDEIGDMPLDIQTRLLRVLEERTVTPLGGDKPIELDLQIISATNQKLEEMRDNCAFRADLFYRLSGFHIQLPNLSERADLEHIIKTLMPGLKLSSNLCFTPAARQLMQSYSWPGNIRELKNILTKATVLSAGGPISTEHLGLTVSKTKSAKKPLDTSDYEKAAILKALEKSRWNITKTAETLGVSRNTLYRKINRMGIELKR